MRVELRPGLGCCQDRRRRSGMTHKVTDGPSGLVVPPRCLPDVDVGLAHPVGLISSLSAISTLLITVLPRGDSTQADPDTVVPLIRRTTA